MTGALFAAMEGEKQGDMEAMLNFCVGINKVNKLTLESIRQKGGWLLAGADDTYILGPPDVTFPEFKLREERLKLIGLELSLPKMKCFTLKSIGTKHIIRQEYDSDDNIIASDRFHVTAFAGFTTQKGESNEARLPKG